MYLQHKEMNCWKDKKVLAEKVLMNSLGLWETVSNNNQNKYHPLKNIFNFTCSLKTFPSHVYYKIYYEVVCLDFGGESLEAKS